MRITTNQILRNYQTNLSNINTKLDSTREKVMTNRKFSRVSDDPSAALKAYKTRKDFLANSDYLENVRAVASHYDAVESSAMQINSQTKEANALILEAINGTSSIEQRKTLATSLRNIQESMVLSANSKFGDTFLFGGQNTVDTPFELKDDKLYYFGIDVGSNDPDDQNKLLQMSKEQILVDVGFGLGVKGDGSIETNTAFNMAFSGLNTLGFGIGDNGNDKNVVNLLGQIAGELEKETLDTDKIKSLTDSFTQTRNEMIDFVTALGTKSNFLTKTEQRLDDARININEKIIDLENVDLAEAITDYSWAQYAYNAALKVGNSILSQSFIDFMR